MVSDRLKRNLKRNHKLFLVERLDLVFNSHDLTTASGARPVPFCLFCLFESEAQALATLVEPGVPLCSCGDL